MNVIMPPECLRGALNDFREEGEEAANRGALNSSDFFAVVTHKLPTTAQLRPHKPDQTI